jgi:hypothetical protein
MAIEIDYQNQKITVNGKDIIDINGVVPSNVAIDPHGVITVNNLKEALDQLADQTFQGETNPIFYSPVSSYLREGALWYQPSTKTLSMYREISPGVYNFVPISSGTGNSDTIDAGAF